MQSADKIHFSTLATDSEPAVAAERFFRGSARRTSATFTPN